SAYIPPITSPVRGWVVARSCGAAAAPCGCRRCRRAPSTAPSRRTRPGWPGASRRSPGSLPWAAATARTRNRRFRRRTPNRRGTHGTYSPSLPFLQLVRGDPLQAVTGGGADEQVTGAFVDDDGVGLAHRRMAPDLLPDPRRQIESDDLVALRARHPHGLRPAIVGERVRG